MSPAAVPGPAPPVEPLAVVALKNATIYPVHASPDPHRMRYGILQEDGTLLQSTVEDRHHGEHTFVPPDPASFDSVDSIPREAIYAGPLYHVYGHFIIESCQRLWYAAEHPDLPLVWTADAKTEPELNGWEVEILEILGIRNPIIIVTRPSRVDSLQVPDAGYKYADWTHPQYVDFLAAHRGPPQEHGLKLWLSLDPANGRGVINRHIIERRLRALGWTTVTFELMGVRAQLDALAWAEVIAGEEASTFHNLLLLDDVRGKRFHIFRRHGPEHLSFKTIGEAREVVQQFHSCSQDALISVAGRAVVRLAPNPAQYLSHLGIPIAPRLNAAFDEKSGSAIRRVNRLAEITGAESYLQLGWCNPAAFTDIEVVRRDVVDEEFGFDVRSYRNEGAHFYEVSLEQFLTWFAKGHRYDVVLLDNQRDWQDALEAIRTVFRMAAHDRTVVVLNHVVASGEPAKDGQPRRGDLHRTVDALHELQPELRVLTIGDDGDSQTVIWQERRTDKRRRRLLGSVAEDVAMAEVHNLVSPRPTGLVSRLLRRFGAGSEELEQARR